MSPTTRRMASQNQSQPSTPSSSPSKSRSKRTPSSTNGTPTTTAPMPPTTTTSSKPAPPSLPTRPPPSYLLIYPFTLALAYAFSLLSPVAYPSVPVTTSTLGGSSHVPNAPAGIPSTANYFSSKRNILNLYFVKILWFWVTLSFALLLYRSRLYIASSPSTLFNDTKRLRRTGQALLRYAVMTLTWILVTQWCFGPALIDRSFTLTGGACTLPTNVERSPFHILTSQNCKATGGIWKGGHDISGHVFLLVLASAFLGLELLGMRGVEGTFSSESTSSKISISMSSTSPPKSPKKSSVSAEEIVSTSSSDKEVGEGAPYHTYIATTIVALCFFMLMMTGIWFHTFFEKLSGLLISLGAIYGVYFLPRGVPALRQFLELPGQI
jgi:hypothetical protein